MMLRVGQLARLIFAGEPSMLSHAYRVPVTNWVLCILEIRRGFQLAVVMK